MEVVVGIAKSGVISHGAFRLNSVFVKFANSCKRKNFFTHSRSKSSNFPYNPPFPWFILRSLLPHTFSKPLLKYPDERVFEEIPEPFGSEEFWCFGEAERRSMPKGTCDCLPARSQAKAGAKTKPKLKRTAASEWLQDL